MTTTAPLCFKKFITFMIASLRCCSFSETGTTDIFVFFFGFVLLEKDDGVLSVLSGDACLSRRSTVGTSRMAVGSLWSKFSIKTVQSPFLLSACCVCKMAPRLMDDGCFQSENSLNEISTLNDKNCQVAFHDPQLLVTGCKTVSLLPLHWLPQRSLARCLQAGQ